MSPLLVALSLVSMVQSPNLQRSPPRFLGRINQPELVKKPVAGIKNVLVLLVNFSDQKNRFPKTDFETILFSSGHHSMQDYYLEVSYGKLTLTGIVNDWITAPQPYSYYVGDSFGLWSRYPNNAKRLVEDVVRLADPVVNFALFDNDGDNYVDGLFVVHSGTGAEATNNKRAIWSHKWQLSDTSLGCSGAYKTNDGVYVDVYSMEPEELVDNELITIGVFCHEFGHVLGLPDLYYTGEPGGPGIGMFCLMAAGSWGGKPAGSKPVHPNSWCKYLLGWLNPDSLEPTGQTSIKGASLPACAQNPKAFRILENPNGADWTADRPGTGEYFLVENRYQTGFDQSLPGSGLLILHIDESQVGNTQKTHPLVGIIQADADSNFLLDDWGRASDLWVNDSLGFSNTSVPASVLYDGTPTGVAVKNISGPGPVMTADLEIGLVLLGRAYSFPNPFITKKNSSNRVTIKYEPTDTVRAKTEYPGFKVTIINLAGELVRVLDQPGEVYPLAREAQWDLKNEKNQEVASGLYFYLIETQKGERNKGMLTVIR